MKKITPREFRNAFMAVMSAEFHSFRIAVGFEAKSYTFYMRSNILPKIAKHLGLLAWKKDYLALDGMFYEERGLDNRGNYSGYAKAIAVAIEHVNQPSKTHESINKLQAYNAPLKVLIGYAASGEETTALLQRYEQVIQDSDVFDDIATQRQQLVVFGTPKTARDWAFFVYERDGFVLLLPG